MAHHPQGTLLPFFTTQGVTQSGRVWWPPQAHGSTWPCRRPEVERAGVCLTCCGHPKASPASGTAGGPPREPGRRERGPCSVSDPQARAPRTPAGEGRVTFLAGWPWAPPHPLCMRSRAASQDSPGTQCRVRERAHCGGGARARSRAVLHRKATFGPWGCGGVGSEQPRRSVRHNAGHSGVQLILVMTSCFCLYGNG